jgi:hypothetical protein
MCTRRRTLPVEGLPHIGCVRAVWRPRLICVLATSRCLRGPLGHDGSCWKQSVDSVFENFQNKTEKLQHGETTYVYHVTALPAKC